MLERLADEIPRFFSWQNMLLLGEAMGITLTMTVVGCVLGFIFAFVIAFTRQVPGLLSLPFRTVAILFVEIFRRIPFLVVLFLVLFFIQAIARGTSLFTVAVVSICIYSTAYIADIIRGGFESVPRQQIEAALAMNFSRWQIMKSVIIPQSWPVVLPPAVAFMVGFIKDTSLVSQIGVFELTFRARELNNMGFSGILVFGTIALLYFAISYPLARWGQWLEKRLAR
ncbi:MAG: amino acid ABC transporter permease [Aestuariivirgaceae bacterium]